MSDRRTFLRTALGAGALAALTDVRHVLAGQLGDLEARVSAAGGLQGLREEYLLGPDVLYLNHASIGTVPRVVHQAHVEYLRLCEENPWLYMWGQAWEEPQEEVRQRGAALLGCEVEEVAIIHNTTEAFNLLAHGLSLGEGDEVLFSSLNHPGAANCWHHLAPARGFQVREFPFPVEEVPGLTAEEVVEIHMREVTERTRVLVFPHLDNIVGLRHPMAALASAARERGVEWVAVDGAQAAGMIPLDVGAAGVDLYATSPHKWVQAPKGLGLMHVRRERQDELPPMWVSSGRPRREGSVRAFEDYGTRNLPALLALGDAVDFQSRVEPRAREERLRALHRQVQEASEASLHLRWRSPRRWEMGSSLYLVEVEGESALDLSDRLYRDEGAVVRPFRTQGLDGLRVSPNIHTRDEEVDRFLALLGV
jgi:isopenicillin-N epimerase